MTILSAALAALALQTAPSASAWTWTLYADSAPIVLANEAPDTPNLRATLECTPGSSVAMITLYGGAAASGVARASAGQATAVTEAEAGRNGGFKAPVRVDHPVFAAFVMDGRLSLAIGEERRAIEVPAAHLAKLRRFAELCAG
jgi:hypothetical protein